MTRSKRMRAAPAVLLAAALLTGCRSTHGRTNVYEPGAEEPVTVIEGSQRLSRSLAIRTPRMRKKGDRMELQFELHNNRQSSLAFQWRLDWFDQDGFRVDDNRATWEPMQLGAGAETTITAIAPRPEAVRWKLQVSTPNESN